MAAGQLLQLVRDQVDGQWELVHASLLAHVDLLASRELELRPPQSLDHLSLELVIRADRDEDLANLDPGGGAVRLTEGASHSGLQPFGTGTGQHFIDPPM